jgi:hypothetical protein
MITASWTHVERRWNPNRFLPTAMWGQFVVTVDGLRMQFTESEVDDGTACDWATKQTYRRIVII